MNYIYTVYPQKNIEGKFLPLHRKFVVQCEIFGFMITLCKNKFMQAPTCVYIVFTWCEMLKWKKSSNAIYVAEIYCEEDYL